MGVKGLWKLIEAAGMPVALETLEHKVLGVDISIWLHQAVRGWKGPGGDSVANAHLLTLFHRICKLLYYRIRPVFIFDGGVPYLKKQTQANRRLRRDIAATKANKVRERLLNNLLKSQAVRQALGKHGPGPAAFHVQKAPRKTDMFELPPMPVKEEKVKDKSITSLDSDSSDDEQSSLLLNINVPNLHQFDLESQEFKSMPLETRSIVLSELALTRKQNSWGTVNEMPEEGGDFSTFQMGRLLHRRNFQKTIEDVQGALQKKNVAEMEAEMFGELEKHASLSQRIVSEDNAMTILVKKTPEKEKKVIDDYKGKSLMKKKAKIQKDFLKELASKGLSFSNNQDMAIKDDSKKFDEDDSFSDDSEDDDLFNKEKKKFQDLSLMRIMDTVVDNSGLTQEELLAIIKQDTNETPQKVDHCIDDQPSTSSNAGGFVFNSDADSDNSNEFVEIVDNVRKKLYSESEKTQDSNIDAILSSKSNSLYLKIVQDKVNVMLQTQKIGKVAIVDTRRPGSTPVKEHLPPSKTPVKEIGIIEGSSHKKKISFDTSVNKMQTSIIDNNIPHKSVNKMQTSIIDNNIPHKSVNHTFNDDESSDDDDFIEVPPPKDLDDAKVHLSNSQNKIVIETIVDSSSDDDDFIEVPILIETKTKPQDIRRSTGNNVGNSSDSSNKVTVDLTFGPTIVKDELFADLFPMVGHSSVPVVIDRPNSNGKIENGHKEEKESPINPKKDNIFAELDEEKSPTDLSPATNNEIDPELKKRIDELVKLEVEKIMGKKIDNHNASSSKSLKDLDNETRSTAKKSELMDTSDDSDVELLIQSSRNNVARPSTPNLSASSKGSASATSTEESEEYDSAEEDVMLTEEFSSCMFVKDNLIPDDMKVPFLMPSISNISNKKEQNSLLLETVSQSSKENIEGTKQISPKSGDGKIILQEEDSVLIEPGSSKNGKIVLQEKDSVLIEPGSSKSEKIVKDTDSVLLEPGSSKSSIKSQEKENVVSSTSSEMEVKNINQSSESPVILENNEPAIESIEQPLKYSEDELKILEGNLAEEHQALVAQAQKVNRVATNLSDQMYVDAQELLQLFGLPYLVAPMEAEAQCAFLDYMNMTQGSITDDSDVFLFGGTRVYKNMFNQNRQVEFFNTLNVQNHFNLNRDNLITLALLTGSDYTEGIETIGAVSGMEIVAEFPGEGIECLQNMKKWWIKNSNSISASHPSGIRQKLSQLSLPESFPNPDVYKAYIEPDIDDSTEKFTWAVPNVNALRAFTTEKFGWSMAKSNDILTPVIKRLGVKETQMRIDSYFTSIKLVKETANTSKRLQDAICRVRGEEPPPKSQSDKKSPGVSKKRGASNANSTSRRKKSKLMDETLDTGVVENIDMDDPDDPNIVEVSDDSKISTATMESELPEAGSSSNVNKRSGPALRIPTDVSEVHSQPKKKLTKEEFKEEMFKAMLNREGITQVQSDKKEMEEKKKKAALLLKNKSIGKKGTSRK